MSVIYDPVHWTPHKNVYDKILLAFVGLYLVLFGALEAILHPQVTAETLVIRATGTLAFLMLHIILCIGPLCRLDKRFLPLLYNRRHLGVTMFLIGLTHGVFNIVQFHTQGNVDPLVSLFVSNTHYGSLVRFPFQSLGFFALIILFLMAATSHDFWLKNLTPPAWKVLHMGVYAAYAMIVMHVMLGVIQLEKSPVLIGLTGLGMFSVIGLHVVAAWKQMKKDQAARPSGVHCPISNIPQGFVYACEVADIPDNRAKMLIIHSENIALFKYGNKLSAVHNLCKHQNGPLSEGKIIDGCITCPWHGYQYRPEDGQSPPPFKEMVCTYDVMVEGTKVYVNPQPYPEGTARPPATIHSSWKSLEVISQ
ncbi:MAG: (2Fe-2S)-binding protein [Haliscomenobacteraceae bacterium CHB4]|nr:Sulfoxide reductase heme-binding subunit YedZ [Saprospiraceae bacterium]MCE7926567.1 (2Fe-2S)-binding protein [Haliscomenobacteraceae bacterium CHB4]